MRGGSISAGDHPARLAGGERRLDRLAQDRDVEDLRGIFRQIGVGITLNHREPSRHTRIHVLL